MNKVVKSIKFNLSLETDNELYQYCMKQNVSFNAFVKDILYKSYLTQQTHIPLIADHDGVFRVKLDY